MPSPFQTGAPPPILVLPSTYFLSLNRFHAQRVKRALLPRCDVKTTSPLNSNRLLIYTLSPPPEVLSPSPSPSTLFEIKIKAPEKVHVLPKEVMGYSTFGLSMWLLKWLPIRILDHILLLIARVIHSDTACLGLQRPLPGPLELKSRSGKTPVLDIDTLAKIKAGEIKVKPAIKRLTKNGAEFVDGKSENFDAIIMATGYRSNVPSWLKESKFISDKDGLPKEEFPNGWQGENGLYAVDLTKRGLMGASIDA